MSTPRLPDGDAQAEATRGVHELASGGFQAPTSTRWGWILQRCAQKTRIAQCQSNAIRESLTAAERLQAASGCSTIGDSSRQAMQCVFLHRAARNASALAFQPSCSIAACCCLAVGPAHLTVAKMHNAEAAYACQRDDAKTGY